MLPMERNLVFVSGYYGFDNLGDEAILEELCNELKQLVRADEIMVLSANPELTARRYGVRAMQRRSLAELFSALSQARLFVSGGGGLFQNTKTLGSIVFYGLQILMARANSARVLIWAQGIGPLRGKLAENICHQIFAQADEISVRDDASLQYIESWKLKGSRTADPVWNLSESALPASVQQLLKEAGAAREKSRCVGISLRPSPDLTDEHLAQLALALAGSLAKDDELLLLPLQPQQDLSVLQAFEKHWQANGRSARTLDGSALELPSQWAAVFAHLKLLVGMRLHAIIMTLKAGRPVAGISYDPKVAQILSEFGQCSLSLSRESQGKDWTEALLPVMKNLKSYATLAATGAAQAKELSARNFEVLSRNLRLPSTRE
jgi:polysaccharide pyruvyl transferase CsaB